MRPRMFRVAGYLLKDCGPQSPADDVALDGFLPDPSQHPTLPRYFNTPKWCVICSHT